MNAQRKRPESIRDLDVQMNASTVPPPNEARGSGVRRAVSRGRGGTVDAPMLPLPGELPRSTFEGEEGGDRGVGVHVEVDLAGHWVVGRVARLVLGGIVVRGVHPFIPVAGEHCRLRVLRTNAEGQERRVSAGVIWRSYDETSGEAELEFEDPTLGALVSAYIQGTQRQR